MKRIKNNIKWIFVSSLTMFCIYVYCDYLMYYSYGNPNFTISDVFLFNVVSPNRTYHKLNGLNQNELIKVYGNPSNEEQFILSDRSLIEIRRSLVDIFPNYKKDSLEIKEMYWNRNYKTTIVWLYKNNGKWIVCDNLMSCISVKY